MKTAGVILAVVLALVLQTTLGRYSSNLPVDLVLVAVVFVALSSGPVTGLWCGTLAGLVQDAMLPGVVGIGGLAKTIVGFITGVVGTQFIVAATLPRFVVFFVATLVHSVVFMGLYLVLDLRQFGSPLGEAARQALGNAVVGVVAFQVVEMLPGAVERRRAQKTRIRR